MVQICFIPSIYGTFASHLWNLYPINSIYRMLESLHMLFNSCHTLHLTSPHLAEEAPHLWSSLTFSSSQPPLTASQKRHYEQPAKSEANTSTQCTSKPTPLPHIRSPRNKHPRHKRQGNSNSAQNTGSLSEPQVSEHWIRYQWKDGAHNVAAKTLCRQSTTAVAMIHIREIVEGCKVDAVDTHC